jgi:hypothetical protein
MHNLNNLNSPSLISLASISSPLTHTATRTEFTYPKAGPTPEQLKLISSRESFGRFGVPYGPDAVAFAASTSRHDLSIPPPDFDTPGSPGLGSSPGPSRLRQTDNDTNLHTVLDTPDTLASVNSEMGPAVTDSDAFATIRRRDVVNEPAAAPPSLPTQAGLTTDGVLSPSLARSQDPDPAAVPLPPSPPSSPKAETDDLPAEPTTNTDRASPVPTKSVPPPLSILTPGHQITAPATTSGLPTKSSAYATASAGPPPSAFNFKSPDAHSLNKRSESRASSVMSYATAMESIAPPSAYHTDYSDYDDDDDDGENTVETPTTPKLAATMHTLEPSDATVRGGPPT